MPYLHFDFTGIPEYLNAMKLSFIRMERRGIYEKRKACNTHIRIVFVCLVFSSHEIWRLHH